MARRAEDPPTPQVPATALRQPGEAAGVAAVAAHNLGVDAAGLQSVIDAVSTGNATALLRTIAWTETPCGDAAPCPTGATTGSTVRIVSASEPFDTYSRTEADTESAARAALDGNAGLLALVGERGNKLYLAFALLETRSLPADLHFSDKAAFVLVELSPGPQPALVAISMSEANPLSAFYRPIDPGLSHLHFASQQVVEMEQESAVHASAAAGGPVPTVGRR